MQHLRPCLLALAFAACAPRARHVERPSAEVERVRPAWVEGWAAWPDDLWSPPPLPSADAPWAADLTEALDEGAQIAAQARGLVGVRSLRRVSRAVTDDCVGLVKLAYAPAGIRLMTETYRGENGVTAIYREAREAGALHLDSPLPGDLVFFRETYDRNKDGLRNDGMTHVGVVVGADAQGTVTYVHRARRGVVRARFNPRFPRLQEDGLGEKLNDTLRPPSLRARAYLAGELFVAYASPQPLRVRRAR